MQIGYKSLVVFWENSFFEEEEFWENS